MNPPLPDPVHLRTRLVDALADPRRRDLVAGTRIASAARERFVAGEEVGDAVAEAVRLRRTQRLAALHPLLPTPTDSAGVAACVTEAVEAIAALAPFTSGGELRSEIYLAPEHLGIGFDSAGAADALAEVCEAGSLHGVDVTLRSGPVEVADEVLELVHRTRRAYPRLTASVVARRHRSEADAAELVAAGTRVRLVRGSDGDPASVAWQDPHEVRLAYARCLAILLDDVPTVVATHDPLLLDLADGLADQSGRGRRGLEYQFFLGVQPDLQMRTADAGHRVRVLVPYGPMWFEHLHDLARRTTGLRSLVTALATSD